MNNKGRMNGLGGFSLFPPVLKTLLIINVVVFFFQYFLLSNLTFSGVSLNYLFEKYFAMQPINFSSGFSFSSEHVFYPWQLITYQFMHGSLGHIFFNLFALWMFGSELENIWGSKKFLIYYLASGVGAAVLHIFVSPFFGPLVPMIGASGAIFGILLGFGMTFPNRPIIMFPLFIPIKAKYFVMLYAGLEMIMGVTSSDGIAHFAHIGGAITGFLLLMYGDKIGLFQSKPKVYKNPFRIEDEYEEDTRLFNNNTRKEGNNNIFKVNWELTKKTAKIEPVKRVDTYSKQFVVDNEIIPQSFIDTLLDKISERGYQSLTDRERKILTEISKQI
jgi:membrane associated rhomboid family serine protease